ncbi:MAG: DUF370 domain-containing protein [Armatimonadetes bacterium]|nr:DUF370 domain-containing protein [Armatimonadota bacterium]
MPIGPLLNVGFSNFVVADKVIALVGSDSAPMRRLVQNLRAEERIIDCTLGRRTKSLIFTSDGKVVLSAITQETLARRLATGEVGIDEE